MEELREQVLRANLELVRSGLVIYTWETLPASTGSAASW